MAKDITFKDQRLNISRLSVFKDCRQIASLCLLSDVMGRKMCNVMAQRPTVRHDKTYPGDLLTHPVLIQYTQYNMSVCHKVTI